MDAVKTAVNLIPLMNQLYEAGILAIDGISKDVLMRKEAFLSTFPEYSVKNGRASVTVGGVRVLCVIDIDE